MILSIGCSHSVGPYDENDVGQRDSGGLYYKTGEEWPSVISNMYNTKYRHIALPGMGMLQYYEVLRYLNENKLLDDIDTIIIQWTHEPRYILPNNKQTLQYMLETDITKMMKSNEEFVLFSALYEPCMNIFATSFLDKIFSGMLTSSIPNTETKLFVTDLMSNITDLFESGTDNKNIEYLVKNEINRICKNNNIKLFQFNWIDTIVKTLDIYNTTDYTNNIGHLNYLGNKKANGLILRELKQQGLFNV
jgi:hypothetical protein